MAVPSAVLRQRERLETELGIKADGTPLAEVPTSPELSVAPSAAPEATPQPTAPAEPAVDTAAQNRIKELEHLLSTRDGQTSTAMREANEARQRADVMASQVTALEESVATLKKQAETAEARATARQAEVSMPSFDTEEPTPEELAKFEPDSVAYISKLSKKQLVGYLKPMAERMAAMEKQLERVSELDKLPHLEKTLKDSETEQQRVREEEFFRREILAHFVDFESVRDSQGWKDYLNQDIPGRGIKNAHLLNQYKLVHNAQGLRSLIQAHYDAIKAKPNLASLATPRGTQTEGTPVVKPNMKASEYQTNLRLWTSKRLPKPKWDAFKSEFETALKENRVDMDARL